MLTVVAVPALSFIPSGEPFSVSYSSAVRRRDGPEATPILKLRKEGAS